MTLTHQTVSTNRTLLMGWAIIFVVLFHFSCWCIETPIINKGFLGVDIFLFLSGYGLYYSYSKNKKLKEFYIKRIRRIYPMFLIMNIVFITVSVFVKHVPLSIVDVVLKLTTLAYWIPDASAADWYLNSLFFFYLITPVLVVLSEKYSRTVYLAMLTITCMIVWCNHDVLMGEKIGLGYSTARIPIFVLGICFANREFTKMEWLSLGVILIFVFVFFKTVCYPLAYSAIVLPMMMLLSPKNVSHSIIGGVKVLGVYSLEIYVANGFVKLCVSNIDSILISSLMYFPLQIIFSIIVIYINKFVQTKMLK